MLKYLLIFLVSARLFAVSGLISNYCDIFYLAHDSNLTSVMPILNVDRAKKFIQGLPSAHQNEVSLKVLGHAEGEPIYRIDLPSPNPDAKKILISGGVHGNEPFGVTTGLEVLEKLLYNRDLRNQYHFVFIPMLNPAGLKRGIRRTMENIDVNRSMTQKQGPQVARLLKKEFKGEEFSLAMDLHGAITKHRFFVIKANQNDDNLARIALSKMDPDSILTSPSGQYPYNVPQTTNPNLTAYVLSAPGETVSANPGTVKDFFSRILGIKKSYTIEYPGQISTLKRQKDFVDLVFEFIINN